MRTKKLISLWAVLLLTFGACSSGGSGGGGTKSSSRNAKYGLRVLHAALDAAPLSIISSAKPGENLGTVKFGRESYYLGLSTGAQTLSLLKGFNASIELASQAINVDKKLKQTLLYYGNNTNLGIRTALISDEIPEVEKGFAALRFIHALSGAQAINFGQVDSLNGSYLELGSNLEFGRASSYFNVAVGPQIIRVSRTVDGQEVVSSVKLFEDRQVYTILVLGEVDYLVLAQQYQDL